MSKHVSKSLKLDQVVPLACTAYALPNERSKESPFFLMFGRDPIVPLNSLLMPTVKYSGTDENILSLEALMNMYKFIASNLELAQKKRILKLPDLTENLVRVILFSLRMTLQECGALGISETIE